MQLVTDNAANCKKAGEKLMETRGGLFWTPCAAHCIDLMLEDFGKHIPSHKETIADAEKITTYLYGKTMLIPLVKELTKGRDWIRTGATRSATSYLILACLNVSSDQWKSSKFATTREGKLVEAIIFYSRGFWSHVDATSCLRAAAPLIKLLRMVDADNPPSIGFLYDGMNRAKERISSNFNNIQRS